MSAIAANVPLLPELEVSCNVIYEGELGLIFLDKIRLPICYYSSV